MKKKNSKGKDRIKNKGKGKRGKKEKDWADKWIDFFEYYKGKI